MEILVELYSISDFFTSILLKIDKFFIIRFQFNTSFAENKEQSIVYVAVIVLICGLFSLLLLDNRKRRKRISFIDKNRDSAKLRSNKEDIQSAELQNVDDANKQNEIKEKAMDVDPHSQNNVNDSDEKPNIYELDNGFVINKRNSGVKEITPTEEKNVPSVNQEEELEKNNISDFLSVNNSNAKMNLTKELSEIEVAMLEVRQEYKSGKISSTDYLSKTQALFKRGEDLVEEQVSISK